MLSFLQKPVIWDDATTYQLAIGTAVGMQSFQIVPTVTDSGIWYYANGTESKSTLGVPPASDTFWSVVPAGATDGELITISATTAPTTANDNTQGYSVGSLWFVTSTNIGYRCISASTGAANWIVTSAGKNNSMTTSPISTNDVTEGYAAGSIWYNTVVGVTFMCTSAAAGAATWELISSPKITVTTTSPDSTNDNTQGYSIGSIWYNLALNLTFISTSVGTGTATWIQITSPKINVSASTAPDVTNDNTEGYSAGSTWYVTSNGNGYFATSVGTGAAVWTPFTGNAA